MARQSDLWTQLYKPTKFQDIIGHVKTIKDMKEWLKGMKQFSKKLVSKKKGGGAPESLPRPILFLHGPSGIGKTVLVNVTLKHARYNIYELNAGEIRSKKRITCILDKIFNNSTVDVMRKRVKTVGTAIVMDEVDGMSCGDKGGLHQLFSMVQEQYSRGNAIVPIICISNRPYEKKLHDAIYVELMASVPGKHELISGLGRICKSESVTIPKQVLEACVSQCEGDVRKTILFLQEFSAFCSKSATEAKFQEFVSVTQQTLSHSNLFEITCSLFSRPHDSQRCFFFYQTDPNLIPLMIHENILPQFKHKKMSSSEFVEEYYRISSNLGMLSRIKSIASVDGESGGKGTQSEINTAYSSLCCASMNSRMCKYESHKTSEIPDIIFTNSLTKSATNSNSHSFFACICYKLNLDASYLCYALPLIVNEIVNTPEIIATSAYNMLTYADIEKIVQIYSKFQFNNSDSITINPRCRRIWKKIKSAS